MAFTACRRHYAVPRTPLATNPAARHAPAAKSDGADSWDRTTLSRSSSGRNDHACSVGEVELRPRVELGPPGYEPGALPVTLPQRGKLVHGGGFEPPFHAHQACVLPSRRSVEHGPVGETRTLTCPLKRRRCCPNTSTGKWLAGPDSNWHPHRVTAGRTTSLCYLPSGFLMRRIGAGGSR